MAEEEKFEELEERFDDKTEESNTTDETASFEVVDEGGSAEGAESLENMEIVEEVGEVSPSQQQVQKRSPVASRISKYNNVVSQPRKRSLVMPIMVILSVLLAGATGFLYWQYTKRQESRREQLSDLEGKDTSKKYKEPNFDKNDEEALTEANNLRFNEQKLCFEIKKVVEKPFASKEEAGEHIKSAEAALGELNKAKDKYNTLLSKSPYDGLMDLRRNLIILSEDEGFLQGRIAKANLYINSSDNNDDGKKESGKGEQEKAPEQVSEQPKQEEQKVPEPVNEQDEQEQAKQSDEPEPQVKEEEKPQVAEAEKGEQKTPDEGNQLGETNKPVVENSPEPEVNKPSTEELPANSGDDNEPKVVVEEKQQPENKEPDVAKVEEKVPGVDSENKNDISNTEQKGDSNEPSQQGEKIQEPVAKQDNGQNVEPTDKTDGKEPSLDENNSKEVPTSDDANKSDQNNAPPETADKKGPSATEDKVDIAVSLLKLADESVIGASELFKEISSKLDSPPTNQDELKLLVQRTNDSIALLIKASEYYKRVKGEYAEEKYKFVDANIAKIDKIKKYLTIASAKLTSLISANSSGEK